MLQKTKISTIAERNRIIERIIEAIISRNSFLLAGHENPDEDCIASMVAFALLLSKFGKTNYLLICSEVHTNFHYLLNICKHNSIELITDCGKLPENIDTAVVLDTPKPSMVMEKKLLRPLFTSASLLVIELDHHLGADSGYIGDEGYRLVTEASSTCELIGLLTFKLGKYENILKKYQIDNLFSRNFVLAVLTGITGDSKMGKYLKSEKEKWFYNLFSSVFDEMLVKKTFEGTSNFSNMDEVYKELVKLSDKEEACFTFMIGRQEKSRFIHYVALDSDRSDYLFTHFDQDTIITMARTVADNLAEQSRYLSLVGFYDPPEVSDLVQFRMRRSEHYKSFDLRTIISHFNIENGGGHEGAIGFRIPRSKINDFNAFIQELISGAEEIAAHLLR
jgi:nanoRNase/pAp phosphatase (c-di-AMP/oligoRNAs hydrolase)